MSAKRHRLRLQQRPVLQRVEFLLASELVDTLDKHARVLATSRARALEDLVFIGLDTLATRGGESLFETTTMSKEVARIDEQAQEMLGLAQAGVGAGLSAEAILAHFAVKSGVIQAEEDELLVEARSLAEDGVQQWMDEIGHTDDRRGPESLASKAAPDECGEPEE
jgi:hypothetical protein